MDIITGTYEKVKDVCKGIYPQGFFDFNFVYVSESERLREIDRFLYESKQTLRFENEYSGAVVIDVSEWNHRINSYFEAFMYFIKDNAEKYDCVLILNERCSADMTDKLKSVFGEASEKKLPLQNEKKKNRIGFAVEEHETYGDGGKHVRS